MEEPSATPISPWMELKQMLEEHDILTRIKEEEGYLGKLSFQIFLIGSVETGVWPQFYIYISSPLILSSLCHLLLFLLEYVTYYLAT